MLLAIPGQSGSRCILVGPRPRPTKLPGLWPLRTGNRYANAASCLAACDAAAVPPNCSGRCQSTGNSQAQTDESPVYPRLGLGPGANAAPARSFPSRRVSGIENWNEVLGDDTESLESTNSGLATPFQATRPTLVGA